MEPNGDNVEQAPAAIVKDASQKKKKEKTKEGKEEKLLIIRANREKKRLLREKNKKRKRGEEVSDDEEEQKEEAAKKAKSEKEDSKHGIWVGNLHFSTSLDTIRSYFSDCGEVTRIKCPKSKEPTKHKGFAYVYFSSPEAVTKGVEKSEQKLDGRALLIKRADDYTRKDGQEPAAPGSSKDGGKKKNPPTPTLFVGNLAFETTRDELRSLFEWAGDIRKVRVATFEDSGKCKGFAYIDYQTVESATKAIRAPDKHVLNGRKIRVEFGSEEAHMRSKPWLMREKKRAAEEVPKKGADKEDTRKKHVEPQPSNDDQTKPKEEWRARRAKSDDPASDKRKKVPQGRVKSGEALSQAQRQKPTVQEFKGTKIVFD